MVPDLQSLEQALRETHMGTAPGRGGESLFPLFWFPQETDFLITGLSLPLYMHGNGDLATW